MRPIKSKPTPPRWAIKLLHWYCAPHLLEEVDGDLQEEFEFQVTQVGITRAKLDYVRNVVGFVRPFAIKRKKSTINNNAMIKSYFTIGWRNLLRHKGYSFINIGGLALGMAVTILIGLWVYDEVSFDQHHTNYERIAQVRKRSTDPNTGITRGGEAMQFPLGTSLKLNYKPYFKHILMAFWFGNYTLNNGDNKISSNGEFIEPGVIDMLSLKMLQGTSEALKDPHSIILSKSKAEAIFGKEDALNKSLKIDNRMEVTVTGVYEDLPANTKFGEVQFFAPWDLWVLSNAWIKNSENDWGNSSFNIYVELNPGVSMEKASAVIRGFWFKNGPKEQEADIKKYKPELLLYPMQQWHLYSEFKDGLPSGGRITFVWLFAIVGIFVLMLACINFMNLSTARSEKRAKEVGVRKTMGSIKWQLVQQFLTESFLVVVMAFVFSLAIVSVSLSTFNQLAEKHLSVPFSLPYFWVISVAFILFTGVLSSLYPAFFLSAFQPVKVLKGNIRLGRFAALPRKVLVVVQFTVSVVLIIGTIVVYQQIQYARNRPIGYTREGLVSVPMNDPNYKGKHDVLRNELLNTGIVSEVSLSSSPITQVWNNMGGFEWTGKDPELASDFSATNVTHEFGKMVNWQLLEGRDFSRDLATDSAAVIINEAAAKYMNLKNPVGEYIKLENRTWQIIGVVNDVIMGSPYEPVRRAFFFLDYNYTAASFINLKIKPTVSASEALPKLEAVFKSIVPSASFDYKFVDLEYAKKFSQEDRIGQLASLFAVLAIFISCLGLFGLASFVAEQRTKEIGLRKVLGASVLNLWKMLSKDFVFLVIIAVSISIPIANYFMKNWLLKYEYRTTISWWVFVTAGAGALIITLLTVSYQSIRAALANPVNSLKSE